ncbi:MAG: hypothetical protein AVDCRST_MAG11-1285 [uncultured Gemmatimonadaceae bacterium]|uniref:Uncharacterized protein n=1 Tax=uncultured Gemmatimonadaceae bacterium TaxID=246130 RepID=A0A6J4KJH1_9BACT|nr:MAG: hypothetical protein AVDCRST_MAG11-1285 [uncultured Gemmatimonadaceae bacterium]
MAERVRRAGAQAAALRTMVATDQRVRVESVREPGPHAAEGAHDDAAAVDEP